MQTNQYLGNLYLENEDWQLATESYEKAITTVELSRSWASTDERRQEIMAKKIAVYESQVQAYINLGQLDKAIETVERSKARSLVELLVKRDLYPKGEVIQEIIIKLDQVRQNIPSQERQLQVAVDKLSKNEDYKQQESLINSQKQLQQELQESRQQLNELLNQIKPIDPSFSLTERVEPISYRDVENLVDEHTAIIQWYVSRNTEKILTFIITGNSHQPVVEQSSTEELETFMNWAGDYFDAYDEWKDRVNSKWKDNLATSLKYLAEVLNIEEIINYIDNTFTKQGTKCERLILIPHRFLHLFPLHAMPLANGDLLIDRFDGGVSYAPSNQLLQLTQQRERPYFSQLFAAQNPTEDLKYADIEVEAILSNFDSFNVLVGKDAKKAKVKTNSHLQSSHCIHFSCHGNFDFDIANASGLLLAKDDSQEYGKLSVAEIFGLNLNQCRLATLSACETGLIDFRNTSDEYIGLPSAFLYAGAANVVSSLWSVNQVSTAFLLIKFYQNLKSGLTVAIALNQAQIWLRDVTVAELQKWASELKLEKKLVQQLQEDLKQLINWFDSDEQPYQEPFYWAAFCAVGQ